MFILINVHASTEWNRVSSMVLKKLKKLLLCADKGVSNMIHLLGIAYISSMIRNQWRNFTDFLYSYFMNENSFHVWIFNTSDNEHIMFENLSVHTIATWKFAVGIAIRFYLLTKTWLPATKVSWQ